MTDTPIHIRITFKTGPGQAKNPDQEYQIAPTELDRLVSEMTSRAPSNQPSPAYGAYTAVRIDGNGYRTETRLIIRFADVLYIG